jgi:hypothetical protein
MLTMLVTATPGAPPLVMHSWVLVLQSFGGPACKVLSPFPPLKRSTLQLQSINQDGYILAAHRNTGNQVPSTAGTTFLLLLPGQQVQARHARKQSMQASQVAGGDI